MSAARILVALFVVVPLGGCGTDTPTAPPASHVPSTVAAPAVTTVPATAPVPLSEGSKTRSVAPCRRFAVDVHPYQVGTGLEQLVRQAHAYRAARERLAAGLLAAAGTGPDQGRIANYVNLLRAGNELLLKAERAARDNDVESAYAALSRWSKGLAQEGRVVRRLQLRSCPR